MGERWPAVDLARRLAAALQLADTALALLVEQPDAGLAAGTEAGEDEVVAETAILLRAAGAVPAAGAPAAGALLSELARRTAVHARSTRVRGAIALHPARALDHGAAHVVLAAAGWQDEQLDELVELALATLGGIACERQPYRELEQAWLELLRAQAREHAAGAPSPALSDAGAAALAPVLARTAAATGIDLLTGSRDDVCALTHALLYGSDFGAWAPPLERPGADALGDARGALAGALDDDDFDLAAELLTAWPLLDAPWDATAAFAFHVLARVEDDVGLLPSLSLDGDEFARRPPAQRGRWAVASSYRTVYVMGLLCALLLRHPQRRPPTAVPASTAPPEPADPAAGQLDALLDALAPAPDGPVPQWRSDFEQLTPAQQAPLTPFLLDVALRRAVRRCDFETTRSLLAAAVGQGVELSPLALQAMRLLARLALVPQRAQGPLETVAPRRAEASASRTIAFGTP